MASGKNHVVQQGECMASIAFENGLFWETLWSAPENAALKTSRESPFALKPGDVVHIPDPRPGHASVTTGARHTFRRKGVPSKLRLRMLSDGEPLAGIPYVVAFAGREITGTTDAQGCIEVFVPPDIPRATLRVGEGDEQQVYTFAPRHLNPAREIDGIQARLKNLGYYDGPLHGRLDEMTAAAIAYFQRDHGLDDTGRPDKTTVTTLDDAYSRQG